MFPQPLLDVLASHPDLPAFEHGDRIVTCGEILDIVRRLVAGFDSAGVGPGAGVAMLTSVTPEAFAAYLAAFTVGCRVVGVPPGYSPAQRAHVLGADIDAVVVDDASHGDLPGIVLSLGPVNGATDVLASGEGAALTIRALRDDVARLVYTSGSTGLPKGCMQTYQAMSARWAWQPQRWSPEIATLAACYDRYLLTGTLASPLIMDQVGLCLIAGGTAVIPTGDAAALLPHGFQRYRITAAIIPVARLYAVLDAMHAGPVDMSSVKALTVTGSPIGVRRFAEAVDMLGPVVYNAYGQVEAGPISMLTPADVERFGEPAMTTVGRPHPDVQLEIRTPDGQPVEPGDIGDIVVRTPTMMSGYWRDPEHTIDVLADGWLDTRDLGHVDGNGLLSLAGRTRDVIIVNAQLTYAGPIEDVLSRHPDVSEAHVIGTPDDSTGEAIHAFVVPAGEREPVSSELADLVRAELGALSVPSTITVVRDVPQTVAGKPDKRALLARKHATES
jgi:acyl-CoA synthetase (AMP-forming)/AMP-acid ligase II